MTVSLLEKARARRVEALASLTNITKTTQPENELFQFDLDIVEKPQKPIIRFVSRRDKAPEQFLAA